MQFAMLLLPFLVRQGDGLKITDVTVGRGPGAQPGDQLTMDYTGTLLNGSVFDSSKKAGRTPFEFTLGVGQVIPGWDKGVVGMKVGGKRILVIPSNMAYGDRDQPGIPANSTLKFVIELRKIKSQHVAKDVIRPGHGPGIKAGDTVTLNYLGTFKDGKKFDSSYDRGTPMTIQVGGGMIPGFTLGLMGMKEGEKAKIVIPSGLAYGERGAGGGKIPPNSDLVFIIEIMKVSR